MGSRAGGRGERELIRSSKGPHRGRGVLTPGQQEGGGEGELIRSSKGPHRGREVWTPGQQGGGVNPVS